MVFLLPQKRGALLSSWPSGRAAGTTTLCVCVSGLWMIVMQEDLTVPGVTHPT